MADGAGDLARGQAGTGPTPASRPPSLSQLRDRTGFDPAFLTSDPAARIPVPLPRPRSDRDGASAAPPLVELPYTHFSVVHRPDRRLAAVTIVGIDGARLVDVDRTGSDFWLDPQLPADQQAGPGLYEGNRFDRGHLVRRRDPVWGPQAEQANTDTFAYPNAAPQVDVFNQGRELWAGLEDYLLTHAATQDRRLVVVTGPVLQPGDPLYRGVQVPLRFFKVAGYLHPSSGRPDGDLELAATGYLLDQTELVARLLGLPPAPRARGAGAADAEQLPDLGAYRTYQLPVSQLADLTGLDLGPLPAADRLSAAAGPVAAAGAGTVTTGRAAWCPLSDSGDIRL